MVTESMWKSIFRTMAPTRIGSVRRSVSIPGNRAMPTALRALDATAALRMSASGRMLSFASTRSARLSFIEAQKMRFSQ